MGYGILIVAAVIVVVLLFTAVSKMGGAGPTSPQRGRNPRANGVTAAEPASDQPTPRADRTVNTISIEASKKIPPG